MKLKRIMASILAICMILSTMSFSVFAEETTYVAKVGDVECVDASAMISALNSASGDVTVEIYGAVEFTDGMELKGSYTSIAFVGKDDDAKITINQSAGGDYLEAHGKTVAFTDLTLTKANPAWSGNSGHMGNYFSVQGGTVTYTNCIFPNGACTNTATATYNNCTFQNTSEYGLWVYDDAYVTVNGGTIDSTKGIKVYSEGEESVTSTLKVENATFTANVTAKPAVAIGYAESITLIGNTYNNTTGVLELDSGSDADCEGVTFVAQDVNGNDISSTLTAVDRSNSNAACGVLVDGKIYTTVTTAAEEATTGSTVTLLHDSTETVELPEGVTLDKNGHTADGVTVKVSAVAKVNGVEYETLAKAIEAATNGDTITLLADCSNVDLTVDKAVTIDLGGKTITDAYIIIKKEIEIKNGDIVNTNEPYPLVIKGGHLTVNDVDIAASKSDRAIWLDGGTLDFNSGSILATKGEGNNKSSIAAIWVSSGQVNINGGTLTVDTPGADAIGVYGNYANAHVTMNDGKISTSGDSYSYGIRVDGDITVTGGEIVTNEKGYGYSSGIRYGNNYALYTCLGDVTVTGGKITTNGYSGYMVNVGRTYSSVDQTVAISDVEFTNNLNEVEQTKGGHKAPVLVWEGSASKVTATITSGTFNGVSSTLLRGDNTTLTVSGGTFENAPDEKYLADGFEMKANADGTYGVQEIKPAVAKIGDTEYATLAEAFAAAKAGDEIVLLANVDDDITVPAGVIFNGNGFAVSGGIIADGDITFAGITKAKDFDVNYVGTTINIGKGASLELTGTDRLVVGHGCTFNIEGNIVDAKTANAAELIPSLIAPGASFTGVDVNFNIKNAYVKFTAYCSSKNSSANGTFNFNVDNSIWEQTGSLVFSAPTSGKDPTFNFNLKDSVLNSTSHLVFAVKKGAIVIDNSNVNVGTSRQIENQSTMTIKNGSVVNGAVATSSNAKNPGTIIVENATYAVTGQFSGSDLGTGTLIIKKGANVSVGSIVDKANIVIDATGMTTEETINFTANLSKFAGTVEVINNDTLEAKIVDGKIVLVTKPAAKIGDTEYATLEEAFKAATDNCIIEILADVTIDYKWDCRDYATNGSHSQFKEVVTINGNNHTIKFTGTINDGNWNTIFRFEENATVKNLTVDISEATGAQRVITAKKSLDIDNLTIIGSAKYGIIFGEGASAEDLANAEISIANSNLNGTRRAISDNEGAKDVKSVIVTGNTLNANVYLSAFESITFNNNIAKGEVDLRAYTEDNTLDVSATGNTLNTEMKNYIEAGGTVNAQGEFVLPPTGTITVAYTTTGTEKPIWGEAKANSKESFEIKLYEEEKVIATTKLNNIGGIIDGTIDVTWSFWYSASDEYWTTTWEEGYPNASMKPDKVVLYSDNVAVAENEVQLNAPDNLKKIYAAAEDKDGNFIGYFTSVEEAAAVANEAGAKIVLQRETTETVELEVGVILDKNGFTAENVTVAVAPVATINGVDYSTLQAAIEEAVEGDIIQLVEGATIEEGEIAIPDVFKNITIKGAEGASLKNTHLVRRTGGAIIEGLTIDGVVFDNSHIMVVAWDNATSLKDWTIINSTFSKNDDTGEASLHMNVGTSVALENLTFKYNVVKDVVGGSKSGIYGQYTGDIIIENNLFDNIAFRPYIIQLTSDDNIADSLVVTGNTFSGSAAGRAQAHTNNAEGTDAINLVVNNNIFKDITDAQQICYWNFNPETTTTDFSKNYYDIVDLEAHPEKIYFNGAASSAEDLVEMGIYPRYTELNEDGTINLESEYTYAPAVATVNGVGYSTLQAAVAAANAGDTITLLAEVEMTNPVEISGKSLTLDLGEYTIYDKSTSVLTTNDNIWGLISLKNDAKLTICGEGTIECNYKVAQGGWTGMAYCINVDNTSELVVEGGNFINGNGGIQTLGKVTVNDGTFISHNGGTCIMANGSDACVTVNDGTFKDYVDVDDDYTGSGAVWGGYGATITINGGYYDFIADPEYDNIVWTLFPAQNVVEGVSGVNANMKVTGGTFVNFNPAIDVIVDYSSSGFTYGSVVADDFAALESMDGKFIVGTKPTATVNDLGKLNVTEYSVWDGSLTEGTGEMPLNFVMQFVADQNEDDMDTSPYADWYADFVITVSGLENDSFVADGCYLAGYYEPFGWVKVPIDGMTIEEGVRYPVMLGVGLGQNYEYICSGVKDFRCAMFLTDEVLEQNPDLKVSLELAVVDSSDGPDNALAALADADSTKVLKVESIEYDAEDFIEDVAQIGEVKYKTLADAIIEAQTGDTIILLENITVGEKITVAENITLDLNGKTISGVCDTNQKYVFIVNNGATMIIKDSSDEKIGKITYEGDNSTGWIVDVEGNLILESGTLELTGTWNIGYAVDVRPNAWGTAYTEPTTFVMNGGKIISSDGAVRVASSSADGSNGHPNYADVSASFTMNNGEIEAAWDGVFVQQSNAAWDVLNVTINNGTIMSDLNPIRFYGPAATSYVNGEDCVDIELNGGTLTYTGTETREWLVDGIIRLGGGVTADDFLKDSSVTASADFAESNVAEGYEWVEANGVYTLHKVENELFKIAQITTSLDSSLALNFYYKSINFTDSDGYYAKVEHAKVDSDGNPNNVTSTILYTDWTSNSEYKVIHYNGIAAKEMTDKVKITIYNAEDVQVSETFEISFEDYALAMIGQSTTSDKWKKAFVDMLNYGAAAQTMFKYKLDNLASEKADEFQEHASTDYTLDTTGCSLPTDVFYATSLTLEDMIALNFYFKNATEDMYAEYSYTTHGGTTIKERVDYSSFINGWGHKGIAVDIAIADANALVTTTLFNKDGTEVGKAVFTVNAYLKGMIDQGKNDALYPALAKFAASAKNAFAAK